MTRQTGCARSIGVEFNVARMGVRLLVLASIVSVMPALAVAQETRAGSIGAEQADKATHLAPYVPHWSENLLLSVRKMLIEQPDGFYPYFGSVYSGGGFTLGGGYRHFTGDRTNLHTAGLYSAKGYKLVQAGATSPGHLSGRLDLSGPCYGGTRRRCHTTVLG